jgi:4-hydroxybenzoate polyprenyltransferase
MNSTIQTLRLLRVLHWIKNLVVFLPVFFAGKILQVFSDGTIWQLALLFIAFCLASSTIYIINDLVDLPFDRKHPEKSKRPLASGFFKRKFAVIVAFITLVIASAFSFMAGEAGLLVAAYFLLNIAYTFWLKKISIVDAACVAIGFVIRVLAGGIAAGVFVSHWILIMVFLLGISIIFAKRRSDLVESNGEQFRKAQKGYTLGFIDMAKTISLTLTLVVYLIYSVSEDVIARIGSDKLYITSLFVFLGIMRYLQISVVDQKAGDPVSTLFKDRFLQVVVILWVITFGIIIYG